MIKAKETQHKKNRRTKRKGIKNKIKQKRS